MGLEKLVSKLLIEGVRTATGYPINTLLVFFIEFVTEQESQISSLEAKLDQHMIGPFRTGLVFLEEARHASTPDIRQDNIRKALNSFVDVTHLSLLSYPLLPVQACFNIGFCYELLVDNKSAMRWYEKTVEKLATTYPEEMKFIKRYEKDLQNYEKKKLVFEKDSSTYQKRKKAYEKRMQEYDQKMIQHQTMLGNLSFLKQQEKKRIKDFILEKLEAEEAKLKTEEDNRKQLDYRPDISMGKSRSLPRHFNEDTLSRQLRNRQKPLKPDLYRNISRPQPGRLDRSTFRSRSQFTPGRLPPNTLRRTPSLQPEQSVQKNDISKLYKILGISRDAQKDLRLFIRMAARNQADQFARTRPRSLMENATSSPILRTLKLILKDDDHLLTIINPPLPPTKPKSPGRPAKPDVPETITQIDALDAQDNKETVFSRFLGKFFKSDTELNKEAILFALNLQKYLQAQR